MQLNQAEDREKKKTTTSSHAPPIIYGIYKWPLIKGQRGKQSET